MRITKSFVDKVERPTPTPDGKAAQAFYRDSAIPGFGLRVTSGGAKSFIAEKRIHGKVKRITIGRYGNLTVEQARKEAMHLLGQVATGKDPIAEKKAQQAKSTTLRQAFDDYLATRKDLKASTTHDYQRNMDGPFADWQNTSLTDITKDMVELRHRTLGKTSHARANNAMRLLRALFNHARIDPDIGQPADIGIGDDFKYKAAERFVIIRFASEAFISFRIASFNRRNIQR